MAKNIQSLQLLRNTSELYATRNAALAALTGNTIPAGTQDGTPVLARYKGTDGKIYTLVGYYADGTKISGSTSGITNMTVFDFEGSAADVKELKDMIGTGVTTSNTVTKQLQDLSGDTTSSKSGDTSVEGAKRYADEKVRAELDKLDYNLAKDENKVVVSFEQKDGKISGMSENITSVKLAGYTVGSDSKVADTDTLGNAIGKLQGQINAMDKSASTVDGQVVTTVAEEDGKVTETKANVKDLQLGGYSKDAAATGAIGSADTINTAISKLENKAAAITIANDDKSINVTTSTSGTNIDVNIKSGEHVLAKDGGNGIYTDLDLVKISTGLSANVREKYQLLASDDSQIGVDIEIPKDSALQNFYLGHVDDRLTNADGQGESDDTDITSGTGDTALVYVMQLANGKYKLTAVNVESFLQESEFADGLQVNSHVVSVKVDTNSEKVTTGENTTADVLTVSSNGVKVNNVQNAINYAISTLDASVSGGTTAGTTTSNHVQVVVDEVDGKLTAVTVNESNIADADDLAELSAKTVTEVASSNDSIAAALSSATDGTKHLDIITDASKIKMTGFTSTDALSGITSSSSITEAFKEVDKVITENEEIVSAALNDLEVRKADKTDVQDKYNHLEDEIKELQSGTSADLAAEIARAKAAEQEIATKVGLTGEESGRTWSVNGASYATGNNVNTSVKNLDTQLKTVSDNYVSGATMNGNAITKNSNILAFTANASTTAGASDESGKAIIITTDESTGGLTFALGTLDCGAY